MKAMVVLAMLAGTAHADDERERREQLEKLEELGLLAQSLGFHSGLEPPYCRGHLANLAALHVPESTTVHVRQLGRKSITLVEARRRCEQLARRGRVEYMADVIAKAFESPSVWAEKCVAEWPRVIAKGVLGSEWVEHSVRTSRGWTTMTGTLKDLRVKWCDNAFTPRRRGE